MNNHMIRLLSTLLLLGAFTFSATVPSFAAPFVVMPSKMGISESQIEPIRYRGRGSYQGARSHQGTRHYQGRRHSNGFPAAALGIFALGTAAIIAGNRQDRYDCGYYYGDCGGYRQGFYGDEYGQDVYRGRYYGNRTYYRRSHGRGNYYDNGDVNSNGINGGGR
jgi:hypothetical protein